MAVQKLTIFQVILKYKKQFIWAFYGQYAYIIGMVIFSAYLTYGQTDRATVYEWGLTSGTISLVYFCLSILPGIARRFGIRTEITQIFMLFRRQIGISTFLFGLLHYSTIRMFPIVFAGVPLNLNPPLFEIFGFLTLYPMTLMFLTSNDISVRKMGKWWRRLHSLSYILVWTIFFHVALQRASIWSIIIGIFVLLETGSLVYFFFKQKTK